MLIHIPSQLLSYTGAPRVDATGATLNDALLDLDRRYPGLRFRIIDEQDNVRQHIRIFVNKEQTFDLKISLTAKDEIRIVGALSGG